MWSTCWFQLMVINKEITRIETSSNFSERVLFLKIVLILNLKEESFSPMDIGCTMVANHLYKLSGRRDIRCSSSRRSNKDGGSSLSARERCFFAKMRKKKESLETAWAIVARTGYAFWMRFIISIICYLFKNDNATGLGRATVDERRHEGQFISFLDDRISRLVHLHVVLVVVVPVEPFRDIHL